MEEHSIYEQEADGALSAAETAATADRTFDAQFHLGRAQIFATLAVGASIDNLARVIFEVDQGRGI